MVLDRNKSYFGLKNIYQEKAGSLSVEEITNSDDIYSNNVNENKQAGKSITGNDSKRVMLTIAGMFLILFLLKKRGK